MKYVLTGVLALTLLTGCGQNDKATGKAALAAIEFDARELPEVKPRAGDASTSAQALQALSLDESGSGRLVFEGRELDGARAVFTDVSLLLPELDSSADALFTDEEIAEIFSWWDNDGDGIADDGSDMTLAEYGAYLNGEDEASAAPVIRAARLEVDGLAVVDGAATFSLMRFSDIAITSAEGSDDESEGKIGSVELVNPSAPMAAWVAGLLGPDAVSDLPSGADLAFDRWAVNDVDFTISDASGSGKFSLGSVFVDALGSEKAGSIGLSQLGFRFDETEFGDVNLSLDGMGITGIDFGLLMAAAGSAGDPGAAAAAIQVDPGNPGFDAMLMKGFTADLAGANVVMESLSSVVGRDKQDRATRISTEPFTVKITPRDNMDGETFAAALAVVGYDSLSLTAAGEQLYDPDADIVTLPKGRNYWQLDNGFRLEMSAKYEGAKALSAASSSALAEEDPEAMLDVLMTKLAIHQLEFTFADSGFFNRALNAAATQSGQDPEQLRGQIAAGLAIAPMLASGTGVDAAVVQELATAASSFVANPKTLRIGFAPPSPLRGEAFMAAASNPGDPASKLDKVRLGFSASNQ